jgi:DNA repair exonuclease SbcCD nuclease subunit
MNKILVFGDLHLKYWNKYQIQAQMNSVLETWGKYLPKYTVFLGDVFEDRKPNPKTIREVYRLFQDLNASLESNDSYCYIIRGNHDTDSKTNNTSEMCSVLEIIEKISNRITFVKDTEVVKLDKGYKLGLIAHFEDEQIIKDRLAKCKNLDLITGHFGFDGCLNRETYDFSIGLDEFQSPAMLGHIHKHEHYKNSDGHDIHLLGTPYSVSWHDKHSDYYVSLIDTTTKDIEFKKVEGGIRHITINDYEIKSWMKKAEKDRFYCIRVMLDPLNEKAYEDDIENLRKKFTERKGTIDFRFRPIVTKKREEMFTVEDPTDYLSEEVLTEYIKSTGTELQKEDLMRTLKEITKDEN